MKRFVTKSMRSKGEGGEEGRNGEEEARSRLPIGPLATLIPILHLDLIGTQIRMKRKIEDEPEANAKKVAPLGPSLALPNARIAIFPTLNYLSIYSFLNLSF